MGDTILLKTVVVEAPMNISDLTDTTVGGVGVFDKLLCTMKAHLQTEYELGRITGVDYANVFLGAYQATLQQSASFLLEKEKQAYELDKLNSDRDLVLAQIKQTNQQTLLIEVQTANAELESSKITQEIQQLGSAIGYTEAQTHMLSVQSDGEEFKNKYILPKELDLAIANIAVQNRQIDMLIAQIAAQAAQSQLYAQKVVTEKAQVDNTVVGSDSAIDQQNKLLKAQRDGYQRDAEQKAAKLMIDTWNVRKNADDTEPVDFINLLADKNIGIAIQAMFTGMGHPAATS